MCRLQRAEGKGSSGRGFRPWPMSWGRADLHGPGMALTEKFGVSPASAGEPWKGVKQRVTLSVSYFGWWGVGLEVE